MADTVIYEQQDAVAIISMNRPDSLNGFTTELREALLHVPHARPGKRSAVRALQGVRAFGEIGDHG